MNRFFFVSSIMVVLVGLFLLLVGIVGKMFSVSIFALCVIGVFFYFAKVFRQRMKGTWVPPEKSKKKAAKKESLSATQKPGRSWLIIPKHIDGQVIAYDYHKNDVAMVGVPEVDFSSFNRFDDIRFVPEPSNEYDNAAIQIFVKETPLGYVYKGRTQDMIHDWIKRGDHIYGAIETVDADKGEIQYYIAFYKDPFIEADKYEQIRTKLTKTSKKIDEYESRKDHCGNLSRGEVLDLDYDDESETYIAFNEMGYEVGEISKAISVKIEEKETSYNAICVVENVDGKDEAGYKVDVLIYFKGI